jgi:hypothetical protein
MITFAICYLAATACTLAPVKQWRAFSISASVAPRLRAQVSAAEAEYFAT